MLQGPQISSSTLLWFTSFIAVLLKFFSQHRARISLLGALAVALRMVGNTRPPTGARQQPVQSIDTAVDFHFFDEDVLFPDPSSRLLDAYL